DRIGDCSIPASARPRGDRDETVVARRSPVASPGRGYIHAARASGRGEVLAGRIDREGALRASITRQGHLKCVSDSSHAPSHDLSVRLNCDGGRATHLASEIRGDLAVQAKPGIEAAIGIYPRDGKVAGLYLSFICIACSHDPAVGLKGDGIRM